MELVPEKDGCAMRSLLLFPRLTLNCPQILIPKVCTLILNPTVCSQLEPQTEQNRDFVTKIFRVNILQPQLVASRTKQR
jgi:hypothetical protein